jgi:hypothetical protein
MRHGNGMQRFHTSSISARFRKWASHRKRPGLDPNEFEFTGRGTGTHFRRCLLLAHDFGGGPTNMQLDYHRQQCKHQHDDKNKGMDHRISHRQNLLHRIILIKIAIAVAVPVLHSGKPDC